MNKPSKRQLYACAERGGSGVFYASLIEQKGSIAEMRSSNPVETGAILKLIPLGGDWDGTPVPRSEIEDAPGALEANVIRREGRGAFHIRILSHEEQNVAERIRAGSLSEDKLKIETERAGLITTAKLTGRMGLESVTRLQTVLAGPQSRDQLVLLDLTGLIYMAQKSLGLLRITLRKAMERGVQMTILVRDESPVAELIESSTLCQLVEIHHSRDEAAASLLRKTLT